MTRQHGLILALLLSLGLNLLVAGVLLGHALDARRRPEAPPMAWAARELPVQLRRDIRAQLRARAPQARALRQELRRAALALRRAAAAEPLDREALAAALQRMRRARGAYESFTHERLLEIVAGLPRKQRLAVLREVLQRRAGRDGPPRSLQRRPQ